MQKKTKLKIYSFFPVVFTTTIAKKEGKTIGTVQQQQFFFYNTVLI